MLFKAFSSPSSFKAIPKHFASSVRNYVAASPFWAWHWIYFIFMCILSSVIFFLASKPFGSTPYIDSLFMVTSCMTTTGLNTVNLSSLSVFQQILLYFLMTLGSPLTISVIVLYIRKRAFHDQYSATIQSNKFNRQDSSRGFGKSPSIKSDASARSSLSNFFADLRSSFGRTSHFYGLSHEDRQRLGSIEYRALHLLNYLIPIYMIACQTIGALIMAPYISHRRLDASVSSGANPFWLGIFLSTSSFSNSGMSLLDSSMIPFATSYPVLLTSATLVLIGNTAFPIFLRVLLRLTLKVLPNKKFCKGWKEIVEYILRYPRRVYTHLFPAYDTWMLFGILIFINAVEWVALEIINKYNPILTQLPHHIRWLDGFYQTAITRCAGFAVFSISALRIGLQALYLAMMFISTYPTIMTMRGSNVYQERALGIYAPEPQDEEKPSSADTEKGLVENTDLLPQKVSNRTRMYFLRQQVESQLGHDVWVPFAATTIILWIEAAHYDEDPITFSAFSILFEVVSAYSGVGLSIGLSDQSYSLSGKFHHLSKLIVCLVMLRGRHRGLPVAIDRAIQLPHADSGALEEQDHDIRVKLGEVDEEMALREATMGSSGFVEESYMNMRERR